jgi:epoxyqueuosine reductase
MKEVIRQRALELAFDDCRFTTAQPPASAPHFQYWLKTGQHGAMAYLERNALKRMDPQLVLPGARSVICLAASYGEVRSRESGVQSQNPTHHSALRTPHSGLIARYARFDDYHDVLGERLKSLAKFVDQLGEEGTRSLWYVDTGPVLERDFAQRAGLGFIGKHTNVINRKLGNWIFLAEILTTLELEPDEPEKNRCGSCSRCITACPTRAITAPFQLDARLCISYLTIELKGPIPVELRAAIGNRIFGCDDCLAICPWNRFAREGQIMKAHAKSDLGTPDLVALLGLDDAGFKRRFAGTPLLRAKRQGLVRNTCVALGNVGDQTALPALQQVATEPDPILSDHARWATRQIQARTTNQMGP